MDLKYTKREGTSGMSGQLYEINLISLILFRLQHDDSIEVLHLASNMDEIGSFDDICFRIKITGHHHPVLVFIQAKHKDNDATSLSYDLIKHFHASYIKVKDKFHLNKDILFKDKFEDTECVFILYTNAKYYTNQVGLHEGVVKQAKKPYHSNISAKLNQLIATGDENTQGYQEDFEDEDLEFVNERILEEEMTALAEHFAKFINIKTNQSMNIMLDKYMLKYHVILAETVVDISEVYSDEKKSIQWRYMTFRSSFFDSADNILTMLKMKICEQIFKTQVMSKKSDVNKGGLKDSAQSYILNSEESTVDELVASFLSKPSAPTLSPLIGTHIIYKNGKLDFIAERPFDDRRILQDINISPLTINEAAEISARSLLLSVKLKVPVTFGNRDMTVSGNLKKVEKRLNTLTDFIADLCKKSQLVDKYQTVVIDESVGDGFLSLNNGIGSAVGNLLIYDNATKHLKFADDFTLLPKNARALYNSLNNKIGDLHVYRLDVQTVTFPKLVFSYSNEAKAILKTVVVYERQSNHSNVEAILKKEIDYHIQCHGPHNFPVRSDTVVTAYHKMMLKWWMSPNGTYLTKAKNIYQETVNNIIKEPQISAMQTTFCMNSLNYMSYDFSKSAMDFLVSRENTSIIIVTDITMLTTVKVIQYYGYDTKYVVLALEYMLNLTSKDFAALISELENTESLPIFVCDNIKNSRTVYKRIDKLATATEDKSIIIIINNDFLETAEEYFPNAQVINNEHSFNDFTTASQRDIINKAEVIFQGEEVSLYPLVVDAPVEFIKGDVLNKIICKQTIMIGKSLSNSRYEEIKHLYIDRKVSQTRDEDQHTEELTNNIRAVRTFHDINDDVVLITAKPGMGKSTLLTHLSVTTKKWDRTIWIIRINLLEHSKIFYDWTVNKTVLNNVKTIKFVCKTILNNNDLQISLKEINNKVYLDGCTGDVWATFELNMFLHFYNEKNILFLFDGFDEICPFYKETFINFLNIVKMYPGEHKMWVTSRPYSEILPDLERALGKAYEIEHISDEQQDIYLTKFWEDRIVRLNFNNDQLKDMITYLDRLLFSIPSGFMSLWKEQDGVHYNLYRTCRHLLHYLRTLLLDGDNQGSNLFAASDDSDNKQQEEIFLGSPLLLYLLADYFVDLLDRAVYSNSRLTFGPGETINIQKVYEGFIDIKLKKILFQDKNKMDIYNPDIMMKCEKERAECYDMHKKLAAHVMLRDSLLHEECSLDEFKDMHPFKEDSEYNTIINKVKTGIEKTGLISYVTIDNIPVFIHRTFAEYFAAKYVWDILKGNKFNYNSKKLLFYAVLFFNTKNVFPWLITEDDVRKEPSLIKLDGETFGFHHCVALFDHRLWSIKQLIRLMASSPLEDFEDDYLNKWIDTLYEREDDYRETHISNLINNIVANMKPHLKRYFTSDGWPVNSAADFSIRYPSTQLRKHLNIIFKEYELFPISCF